GLHRDPYLRHRRVHGTGLHWVGERLMPMPPSVTKIDRNGVTCISSVDRAQYTIQELTRAALKDTAKFLRRRTPDKLRQRPGMRRPIRLWRSAQYWGLRQELELIMGYKHDAWYGARGEIGTEVQPRRIILRETVW